DAGKARRSQHRSRYHPGTTWRAAGLMIYVIDTSVAFKWVVTEISTDTALLLRDDFRNGILELQAPAVFSIELAHALTRAERQGRIPVGQARVLWADVMTLPPRLV